MALNFDGSTEYLQWNSGTGIADDGADQGNIFMAVWFKAENLTGGDQYLVSNVDGTDDGIGIIYEDEGTGSYAVESMRSIAVGNGSFSQSGTSANSVTADTWHHYAAWYSTPGTNQYKSFIDGSEDTFYGTAPANHLSGESGQSIEIGRANGAVAYFDGSIANVAVWSTAYTGDIEGSVFESLAAGADPMFYIGSGSNARWRMQFCAHLDDHDGSNAYSAVEGYRHVQVGTVDTVGGTPTDEAFPHTIYSYHQDIGFGPAAGGGGGGSGIKWNGTDIDLNGLTNDKWNGYA